MKSLILSIFNRLGYDVIKAEIQPNRNYKTDSPLDRKIIDIIFDFYGTIKPFYDDTIPEPLKIAGMWKGILEKGRKTQIKLIQEKDKEKYHTLQ